MSPALDPALVGLGLMVGALVGLTGMGGGSLLTPLLILVVGVRPVVAVGTDLAFAALTKAAGSWQHARSGTADLRLVQQLAYGSVPGAILGAQLVGGLQALGGALADAVIARVLGVLLVFAAAANLLQSRGHVSETEPASPPAGGGISLLGLCVGVLVSVSSVGAGTVLMPTLTLCYRLPAVRAVGTDVVHGALLSLVAAMGHVARGGIELPLLGSLLVGSLPGVVAASWGCRRLANRPLRAGIAFVLAVSGLRLLVAGV